MLYPIGIQDFEKIRKDGFVYVDKTDLEKSWIQYPVLRFDLSGKQYKSISDLTEILFQHLVKLEDLYGVKPQIESPEARFKDVIDAALRQIVEKGYARRFADDNRQIFKIGVRFSTENRCIDSWKLAE